MAQERKNTAIFTAFDDYEHAELATPEKNLLRAVLLNAIADMGRSGEFSRRARDYFLSREDDYVFSFHSVCAFLNINPEHILIVIGLTPGHASEARDHNGASVFGDPGDDREARSSDSSESDDYASN